MDIKHLKTFSTVAETGNFSHASQVLGYAQPTVSTHIQILEKELNVRLFERLAHKVTLTQEGQRLLYYAENILKLSYEAVEAISANDAVAGKITIGANESFSVVRLPSVIKHFIQKYPQVEISLKFGSVKGIHEQLQNNTVDVAFFLTREVSYPDLIIETLVTEPVVVVISPDHPFASRTSVDIREFEDQDLVVTQENCTYRAMIDEYLVEAKVHPRSHIEINNIQAIKQLVMSGLGITILPRISVEYEIAQNLLLEIPWTEHPLPVYTQIAYHKDKWLSPTILSFLEQTRSNFKKL
ncbi:transcriptional regulator, lysr family [hydrocarbon metagenome]|uniref:Transcriptional regulator, lysr family n=1 Tax=hydrocarbon metagenome TaxID=938273 RepID=A0A0W8E293_9ZZZZ